MLKIRYAKIMAFKKSGMLNIWCATNAYGPKCAKALAHEYIDIWAHKYFEQAGSRARKYFDQMGLAQVSFR